MTAMFFRNMIWFVRAACVGHVPEVVEVIRRAGGKEDDRRRGPARLPADREHQSADQLDDERNCGAYFRQRQALACDRVGRAFESADLAVPAVDEHDCEQHAADEREQVLAFRSCACRRQGRSNSSTSAACPRSRTTSASRSSFAASPGGERRSVDVDAAAGDVHVGAPPCASAWRADSVAVEERRIDCRVLVDRRLRRRARRDAAIRRSRPRFSAVRHAASAHNRGRCRCARAGSRSAGNGRAAVRDGLNSLC